MFTTYFLFLFENIIICNQHNIITCTVPLSLVFVFFSSRFQPHHAITSHGS